MRLQKFISACGACSRRKAEELILAGRVSVNGRAASLGESVDEATDEVFLDGKRLSMPGGRTYILLNKPRGCVTTLSDPRGRTTVADLTSDVGVRLYPVGRLDMMSEGLLLLTDDGEAANRMAHPSHGVKKVYRVWVHGERASDRIMALTGPLTYQGVSYRPAEVRILHSTDNKVQAEITLGEGKNREIRNMCAAVGLKVERLQRISQGELMLGDLPVGKWRRLTEAEIRTLKE